MTARTVAPKALLFAALCAGPAPAQTPAPAAAAPRIEWQRTLEDALAVQQATGLPLLLVVNMDGETFNDQFAGRTYHEATFVESTRGYVCVVASPDRHTERDYDALGRRVECPRFPGLVCSEHQNIEPELFRRWFDGKRNAPRHLGVGLDGKVMFDRYLDASMQTAIDAVAKHRGTPKPGVLAPTQDIAELLKRRDNGARGTLERLYREGDKAQRQRILRAAAVAGNQPVDLLRMALRDEDPDVFALVAPALAKAAGKDALIDLEDALAKVDDKEAIATLLGRVRELAADDAAAKRLLSHFDWQDQPLLPLPMPWSNPWAEAPFDAGSREAIEAALDRAEAARKKAPGDEAALLALAEAQLALGDFLAETRGKGAEFWFDDSKATAAKVKDPALLPEAAAVVAVATWQRGEPQAAWAAVQQALAAPRNVRQPDGWLAARFLAVLVQGTAQLGYDKAAADATASLRGEIVRVVASLRQLGERGRVAEGTFLAGIGLLEYAGLRRLGQKELAALAERFPGSAAVHERWRNRLFVDLGGEGLRAAYAKFAAAHGKDPQALWFAGFAAQAAADQHVRDDRRDVALAAYGEAIERFAESGKDADCADSAHAHEVQALAGRALLRHQAGQDEAAVGDLLRAAELRPASLDEVDGLERKPRAIAGRIARELQAAGKGELAQKLAAIAQ